MNKYIIVAVLLLAGCASPGTRLTDKSKANCVKWEMMELEISGMPEFSLPTSEAGLLNTGFVMAKVCVKEK